MKAALVIQLLEVVGGVLLVAVAAWRLFRIARRPGPTRGASAADSKRPGGR